MVEWGPTKTINKYTDKPNSITYSGPFHCIVFRRRSGWAYTVRASMEGGRFVQISTDSGTTFKNEEVAKLAGLASMEDLNLMVEPVNEPWPA